MHISHSGVITVKTPHKSKRFVSALLNDKSSWIEKQIEKNALRSKITINLEDEVLLFGEIYSIDSAEATKLREKLHRLRTATKEKVLKAYDTFYKEAAMLYLTQEANRQAKRMNLQFSGLKFRKMKSRWGSCSSKGIVTFNTKLMKLEKELILYVVIHELAHLVHMNHSKAFHDLVEAYLPNSKEIRKRLKAVSIVS
ncbi:M48 family metallopeptidase [Sulfurimonas paralvinellae]|uniref:M48 family metallopeptidase n=1 Tax=Sulfurimonas paralvinellae TaxID=317658 RepID=A0A7M1BAH3_9BACT|nr:M48 family metallopeptidase [Sulfurimonas paralvinellae]